MIYLTLASMIRNEEHYVQEWLTFHHIQGFEQFVIVLHKCDDKTEERIKALPFADKIRIHKIVCDTKQTQMSTFVWITEHYGNTTEWLMFCDGDEYSFGTDTDDFREVLSKYEEFGGLFVNWLEFGHCNQIERPERLCIETYTKRAAADSWWHASGKSIIKSRELLQPYAPASQNDKLGYSFLSPHLFKTANRRCIPILRRCLIGSGGVANTSAMTLPGVTITVIEVGRIGFAGYSVEIAMMVMSRILMVNILGSSGSAAVIGR